MTMENMDFSDLNPAFADAPKGSAFDNLPDGSYTVSVERVELKKSKAGNRMLTWQLTVLNGPHAGRKLFRQNMIETPDNMMWLKSDLATCGMDVDGMLIVELPSRLGELLDVCLEVQQKTKGEFLNVYFNKRVDPPEGGGQAETFDNPLALAPEFVDDSQETADDLPF